jgi:hypothetical protein
MELGCGAGFLWFLTRLPGRLGSKNQNGGWKHRCTNIKMPLNIVRGLLRGATRGVLTGKKGNKQFYKGKRVKSKWEALGGKHAYFCLKNKAKGKS